VAQSHPSAILSDPSAHTLVAGELEATFVPGCGMLGASLRHRGVEMLRRVDDLDTARAYGSTAGIPLLYPWANRLGGFRYRAAEREVELDPRSPLLHLDGNGLPIHGVPWSMLAWEVTAATPRRLAARIEWTRDDLLAVFSFRHRVEMTASLETSGLTLETTLTANYGDSVPVSFGFHPYFGLRDIARNEWRLTLPAMRRIVLDARQIPTGTEEAFAGWHTALGDAGFDDGFALLDARASLCLSGAGRRISVDFLKGYRYAQVYAPREQALVALEPMTAPTNALASGRGLRFVEPDGSFSAAFRIRVEQV